MVRLCNMPAQDTTERGWSTSKRVLSALSHSRPPVRWACCQEMSSTPPAPSLHCCSGTSQTRINPSKTLVCTYKKVSNYVYLQNKFTDGVKFIVKIVPSDSVIIGLERQLLKILTQTQEPDTKCQKLNVLVLFPPVPYLKWSWVIGDVIITVWIGIQPKEYLHHPAPFIVSHPCYWFSCIFQIYKIRLVDLKNKI
jgi:hypothetical protein